MPDVIDYTTEIAAQTTLATAASLELTTQQAILQDPLVTKQAMVDEQTARKLRDIDLTKYLIAVASFAGQDALGNQLTSYSRSPAVALPVNNGDSLEEAIAKLLTIVNKHPESPGMVKLYYGASTSIATLDGGTAGTVTSNTGPFWLVCDGTNGTPDLRDRFALASLTFTCTTTSASTSVTTATTATMVAGMRVFGTGIPALATIASITNGTTFVLSAAATASGSVTLSFAGNTGGASTVALTLAQMPAHTHNVSASISGGFSAVNPAGTGLDLGDGGNAGASTAITVTEASRGSGSAHENMPPYARGGHYIMRSARLNYS